MNKLIKSATFAGGCFWCTVPPYEKLDGIEAVISGYTGGEESDPTYFTVVRGETGHSESVRIYYDANKINYRTLVDTFWQCIDPTDSGGQFFDRGKQYSTAIFYEDENEKVIAGKSKRALERSAKFNRPIVTKILPSSSFYAAEAEHQQYHLKNPTHYSHYTVGSGRVAFMKRYWKK